MNKVYNKLSKLSDVSDAIDVYANEIAIALRLSLESTKIECVDNQVDSTVCKVIQVEISRNNFYNFVVAEKLSIDSIVNHFNNKINCVCLIDHNDVYSAELIDVTGNNIEYISIKSKQSNIYDAVSNTVNNLSVCFGEVIEKDRTSISANYSGINLELNKIYNVDCMDAMKRMSDSCVDFVLTDIPYDGVNDMAENDTRRVENRLRVIDKSDADIITFDLDQFLENVHRVSNGSICIFCGIGQVSQIYNFFLKNECTVRLIIWEKNNPSPMNGEYVYLSGIEIAVWAKKKGHGVFNGFCKNTVFKYSSGTRDIHPTQKNIDLFEDIIKDNTDEGMVVFDPCMGSGTTAKACINTGREFVGCEKSTKYWKDACDSMGILA